MHRLHGQVSPGSSIQRQSKRGRTGSAPSLAESGELFTLLPPYEYPTWTGWSRKIMLAFSFQLYLLKVVFWPSLAIEHGPSSKRRPVELEQPGPPLSLM